jgi:hypothetical protein
VNACSAKQSPVYPVGRIGENDSEDIFTKMTHDFCSKEHIDAAAWIVHQRENRLHDQIMDF